MWRTTPRPSPSTRAPRSARAAGFATTESWLLCDAARLGAPGQVADRLAEIAAGCDGSLLPARAAFAAALAAADPRRLEATAADLEATGAALLAAEAWTAGGDAWLRAGQARRATTAKGRAAAQLDHCEGARTFGLVNPGGAPPLTAREREIAALAAAGRSSKQIAGHLVLSARTVDNHLQRIYIKLGVSNRGELAAALERR